MQELESDKGILGLHRCGIVVGFLMAWKPDVQERGLSIPRSVLNKREATAIYREGRSPPDLPPPPFD